MLKIEYILYAARTFDKYLIDPFCMLLVHLNNI